MVDIKYDYLLKNAKVIDGLDRESFDADILIKDDIIKKIILKNTPFSFKNPKNIIDCKKKYIVPGFIDIHSHSELQVLRDSNMISKLQQGITTEVVGNCGVGIYPIDLSNKVAIEAVHSSTRDVLGDFEYSWTDFKSFTKRVKETGNGTNLLFLQSHTALRANVIFPSANRVATDEEIAKMCDLLSKSLKQGCIGFSSGLYYAPCVYADKKELIALLNVVKKHNKLFAVHHRCEGDEVISSLKEVIDLARITRVRLEVSHLKAIGKDNQKYVPQMLSLIDSAKDEGIDIGFDQYPYEYGSTSLFSLLPPSYLKLSPQELHSALSNSEDRNIIKQAIIKGDGWDSLIKMCGFENISIMYLESQREFEHLTLREIGEIKYGNTDESSAFESFFDLLRDEKGVALMMDITQSIDSLETILKHPLMCFGTDSLYSGSPLSTIPTHPRSYQAGVHYLELFHKRLNTLPLESLIYRMTGKTAKRLNINDRGVIKENYKADLLILDLDRLKDLSTIKNPKIKAKGIDNVFVNGSLVLCNGEIVSKPNGSILLQ